MATLDVLKRILNTVVQSQSEPCLKLGQDGHLNNFCRISTQ